MEIKKELIIRTGIFVIALINTAFALFGMSPLPAEATTLVTITAGLWVYWKNNSWTAEAITADKVLDVLREHQGDVSIEMRGEYDEDLSVTE